MTSLKVNSKFAKIIVIEAFFCALLGGASSLIMGWLYFPFLLTLATAFIGLLLLIKIIQVLLNPDLPMGFKIMQFIFYTFFKLISLGLVGIALNRMPELPMVAVAIGASFYWAAPALAGLICSRE